MDGLGASYKFGCGDEGRGVIEAVKRDSKGFIIDWTIDGIATIITVGGLLTSLL